MIAVIEVLFVTYLLAGLFIFIATMVLAFLEGLLEYDTIIVAMIYSAFWIYTVPKALIEYMPL